MSTTWLTLGGPLDCIHVPCYPPRTLLAQPRISDVWCHKSYKRTTIIITKALHTIQLTDLTYMNFTYYLNLPHLVDFFTTFFGWHRDLQLLKQYTSTAKNNTKHAIQIELQNSEMQTCNKICHTYWSSASSLKWKRKQNKKKIITTGIDIQTCMVILFFYRCTMIHKNDSTHLLSMTGLSALQNKTPYVKQLSLM